MIPLFPFIPNIIYKLSSKIMFHPRYARLISFRNFLVSNANSQRDDLQCLK